MKFRSTSLVAAAITATAFLALPQAASASLVYKSEISVGGLGFGAAPRDLTLSSKGNATTESGGVGVSSTGTITFGSIIADGSVHDGNGITNSSSLDDLPNPRADNQKYGIPTIGSLGITTASQIGILFNATENGGDGLTVTDLTLKFYNSAGTVIGAIDGSATFLDTVAGNGAAGFTFGVSDDELAYVNTLLGDPTTRLALEATITGVSGGPESFLAYNLGTAVTPVPEPETYALMLAGLGALSFVAKRRKAA